MRIPEGRGSVAVLVEVLAVLRLAFTLRFDSSRLVSRDATIVLLGAAAFAIWAALGSLRLDDPVTPDLSGLPAIAAVAAIAAGLAWMLSRLTRVPVRQAMWLVAGYLPAVAMGAWALGANVSHTTALAIAGALATHAALYFFFGLRELAGRAVPGAWLVLAASIAAVLALGNRVQLDAGVWAVRQSPAELARFAESARRTEELLYAQPERIDAALRAVDDAVSPASRMYYLGFAGFGDQKVFAEEIALSAQRVHDRYDTSRRRLFLVNDLRDFDAHMLASPEALRRALRGIAQRMDRERDVLFMALSSHGKREARLVVTNGALPLNWLTGEALARMLRESGIRWKVLVISACYAGAFIEHLRDDHTIVITASAADQTSFGCRDDRELTYFGEAFYRDALPKAPNLRAAFDAAAAAISMRERREGLEPSRPQAHFGRAMVTKLEEFE
jgi:hypothetical protein